MAEYNIISSKGFGSVTEYPECLPSADKLEQMYNSGCILYKDGKKLTLKDALKEITSKSKK